MQKIRFGGNRRSQVASTPQDDEDALLDSDVVAENKRIRESNLGELFQTENLVLKDLTKLYGKFKAVDNLCLGVQKGECFGNVQRKSSSYVFLINIFCSF